MSYGRTPLFGKLIQVLRQAHWLNRHPHQRSFFFEAQEAVGISRRDFVRMLGAAGLSVASGGLSACALRTTGSSIRGTLGGEPVAVLGGGVSGLTAAYHLMRAGIPCEIFEASNRLGGRMFTRNDFNQEGMFCELGGELVDTNHDDLIALANELHVGIQELKAPDRGVDLYFFAGRHYSDGELIPFFRPFAGKLAEDQKGIYDAAENFTEKARKFDRMNLAEYLAKTGHNVERWVVDMLRVAYTIEYGRSVDDQSALNLITLLEADTTNGFKLFGKSDESKRIKRGSSSLTSALARAIERKVKINQGFRLVGVRQSGSQLALSFSTSGSTKSLKFARTICTLPFTMLREVDGIKALGLSQEKQRAIAELGYGDNTKVMSGFTERWWRHPGLLPLSVTSNGSVFTDLSFQCTWETSRGQRGKSGILTNYLGGPTARNLARDHFSRFKEGLGRVFPGIGDKFDGNRATMNWSEYKYTRGSYTCPLAGQYTTLLQSTGRTELGGRLLFAGEHTSPDFSGFMNGAVESGIRAAREIIESRKRTLPKAA